MSLKNYKYTSTFFSTAKIATLSDEDRFIAKASLAPLKGLLPTDVNPENDPDLLYFSSNGAVAGLVNKNGDSVSNETAIVINSSAKNKYVSADHDREKVCGVVLYPGFSAFGSNVPMTLEEAMAAQEPINMSFAGVLWKVINPLLAKYIASTDESSLSFSWEIAFNSYDIGVGSKNLFDAKIIKAEDPNFNIYDSYLKANKGEGKDPAGQDVFRIIGADSIILGYSIVPNPAAEVKGILPLDKKEQPLQAETEEKNGLDQIPESQRAYLQQQPNASVGFQICDITLISGAKLLNIPIFSCRYLPKGIDTLQIASIIISQKDIEKNITYSEARVNNNTEKLMSKKITNLTELESILGAFESTAAVVDFVRAIQEGSEKYVKEIEAKEALVQSAETARLDAEKKNKELAASIDSLKADLDTIRAQAAQAEADQKFQERMASFDEEFDLDEEDRKIIASDVKDISDEAFASYMSKCKKLMAAKKKGAKPFGKPADDEDTKENEDDEEKKEDSKASDKLVKEALASVTPDDEKQVIRDTVNLDDKNLVEEMGKAFGKSFKVNGESVESRKAKRAEKAEKAKK